MGRLFIVPLDRSIPHHNDRTRIMAEAIRAFGGSQCNVPDAIEKDCFTSQHCSFNGSTPANFMEPGDAQYAIVVTRNRKFVGCIYVSWKKFTIYISNLCVVASQRSSGVGRELLSQVTRLFPGVEVQLHIAKQGRGMSHMAQKELDRRFPKLAQFYGGVGFRVIKRDDNGQMLMKCMEMHTNPPKYPIVAIGWGSRTFEKNQFMMAHLLQKREFLNYRKRLGAFRMGHNKLRPSYPSRLVSAVEKRVEKHLDRLHLR